MPNITDILARLRDTENPIEDLDAFIAEVETAHTEDLAIRDAKVKKTQEDFEKLNTQHDKLKITNYDLMMSKPAEPALGEDQEQQSNDADLGIDALFKD